MTSYNRQHRPTAKEVGAMPIPDDVQVLYGSDTTLLTTPMDKEVSMINFQVRSGEWNIRAGDFTVSGMPAAYLHGADVTDNGAIGMTSDNGILTFCAAEKITVKSYAADDELVYWYT